MSWDYRRLHTSDTPISSAIRMAAMMSMLTGMHRCHPHTPTLIVTRKRNWVILFDGDKFRHWFIQSLTTRTTQEHCVDRWYGNHNGNICWTFWSSLLRNTRLSVSLEIRRVIQRLVGIFKLRFSLVNLREVNLVFSLIRKFRATHLGSDLCSGAEAQLVNHAIQVS